MANKGPAQFVYEYLKDAAESVEMDVDGGTPVAYEYVVPTGKTFLLARFNMSIVDGSMQYGKFGGLTALTNGVKLEAINRDGTTVLLDFTGGQNLKANEDFANLAGVDAIAEPTAGDDFMPVRFTVHKAGAYIALQELQIIRATVQDNLADLSYFRIMVQGTFLEP